MHVSVRPAGALAIALLAIAGPALASKPRELTRRIADVQVRIILSEAVFGRLYVENPRVQENPDMCPICERMARTADSLLWIPVGFAWEREGGLLLDPVITLVTKGGRLFQSCEAWAGRPTRTGLVTVRTPVRIPPGWECEPEFAEWKGVSVYVAFPREIHPAGGGWPFSLHLEDVEDVNVKVN